MKEDLTAGRGARDESEGPFDRLLRAFDEAAAAGARDGVSVGERLGPYRVERLVGRGGMGAVFLARRDDGQFEQRVAVKVLRRGIASGDAYRRFLAERQILARLSHPAISRVYDGGVTGTGMPYLVMEYVEGLPIDEHCDRRRLTVNARLRLFLEVCDAVQYAHRHLIVHRDVKPGNIQVTEEGQPKLLDFGIAKLLDRDRAAEGASVTRTGVRLMTPRYASPEQRAGEAVTTASDVYQLGLLLYELLTGRRAGGPRGEWDPASPPPVPSRAVRAVEGAEAGAEETAAARGTSLPQLSRKLAGDLDNIVGKALRLDPERRYATAGALAEDVRRHLAHERVGASPPTIRYRLRKFARRHAVGTAVTAGLVLTLLVAVGLSLRSAAISERQRAAIATEARTAEEVTGFLVDLFRSPEMVPAVADTLTVRAVLGRGAERIDALADHPRVQGRLLLTLGRAYQRLGLRREAEPLLWRAAAIQAERGPEAASDHVDALLTLAANLSAIGDPVDNPDALRAADSVYAVAAREAAALPADSGYLAEALDGLGELAARRGDHDSATAVLSRALTLDADRFGPGHARTALRAEALARALRRAGRLDSAAALFQWAAAVYRADTTLVARRDLARLLNSLGILLRERGDHQGAEAAFEESLRLGEEVHAPDERIVLLFNQAGTRAEDGRPEAAEAALLEALRVSDEAFPEGHWQRGRTRAALGRFHVQREEWRRAERYLARTLEIYRRGLGPDHPWTARAEAELGSVLAALGRHEEAERLMLSARRVLRERGGPYDRMREDVERRLAELYEAWGRPDRVGSRR